MDRTIVKISLLGIGLFLLFAFGNKQEDKPSYAWLSGSWSGDGFGGSSEEMWSTSDEEGRMMGSYRHFKADGSLNFYEFLILDQNGLQLKHFTPELDGWEEKDEHMTFKMISYVLKSIYMEGLKLIYFPSGKIEIYLNMKNY